MTAKQQIEELQKRLKALEERQNLWAMQLRYCLYMQAAMSARTERFILETLISLPEEGKIEKVLEAARNQEQIFNQKEKEAKALVDMLKTKHGTDVLPN